MTADPLPALASAAEGSGAFVGYTVIVSPMLPTMKRELYPRSLGRSKRRARQGHRQHTRLVPDAHAYRMGGRLFVSAEFFAALRAREAAP